MTPTPEQKARGLEEIIRAEIPWIANSLQESIANLGYPVGMGVSPNADACQKAATIIARQIFLAIEKSTARAGGEG